MLHGSTPTRARVLGAAAAAAGVAALPRFARGAGKPVVRIGFLDSFSGVFADVAALHKTGAQLALEDINRTSRVTFELVFGDDASNPATAGTEARRLIGQEKVDVLFGGTSSANGLALGPLVDELGIFNLALGPFDSTLTGEKARRLTYRFGCNARMVMRPLANRLLALGKKWYFLQSDYGMGRDSYAQLSQALQRAGGTEVGHDVVPLGTSEFSPSLTKIRNSGADVLILANSGQDAANSIKQFVAFGMQKQMHLAGINLEDFYFKVVPLDAIAGATFSVLWSPYASDSSRKLAARIHRAINAPVSARHFYGYGGLVALTDRILAAHTTDAEKLAAAFDDHAFDGYKGTRSVWHGCDHQLAQDVYAGAVVNAKTFARTQFLFDVQSEVPAAESDGTCDSPWARAAKAAMASQTIGHREGYAPKTV
jgi:branched-chain amino acid transport system substrate-binding protein